MRRFTALAILCAATLSAAAFGDIIDFKDGHSVTGTVTRAGGSVSIKTDDGKTVAVRDADIFRVSRTPLDREAAVEWDKVSRSLKDADDIKRVVDLVQKYVDKYGATDTGPEAAAALTRYKELAAGDAVKFHGQWMSNADKLVVTRAWRDAAQSTLNAYYDSKCRVALDGAKDLIAKDKENVNALALAGLASYTLSDARAARTYFTTLAAADNTSPLAENNLGVLSLQQKQYAEALAHFYKAMQINPDQLTLIDNTSGALSAYLANNGDKNATTFLKLKKIFDLANKRMETTMAGLGMARFEGKWLTRQEADQKTAAKAELQKKMAALEAQYQKGKTELARLEAQIKNADDTAQSALMSVVEINRQINQATGPNAAPRIAQLSASRDQANQIVERSQNQSKQYAIQREQLLDSSKDIFTQRDDMTTQMTGLSDNSFGVSYVMIEPEEGDGTTRIAGNTVTLIGPPAAPTADVAPKEKRLVQIALLLDTSGSMAFFRNQAKWTLCQWINEVAKDSAAGSEVQVALYAYGSPTLGKDNGYITQLLPLTTDLAKVADILNRLGNAGGDEYCGWAMKDAVEQLTWSDDPKAYKRIFIAGNEPFSQGPMSYHSAIAEAKEHGIGLKVLFCGYESKDCLDWMAAANEAGGTYTSLGH